MRDCFLFIESNTTGTGRLFIDAARALNLEPVVVLRSVARYPFLRQEGVRVVRASGFSASNILRRLNAEGVRISSIRGVVSSSDYFVGVAARVAAALDLPSPPADAIESCRDKARQYEILRERSVAIPATHLVREQSELFAAAAGIGYPVVIKPRSGSGSYRVRLCSDERELDDAAREILGQPLNERGQRVPAGVLLQQYVAGDEFSVEVLEGQAIGITRKRLSSHPHFVEIGHDFPSVLDGNEEKTVAQAAERATCALGLSFGATHVEVRSSGHAATVIEVNPRLGGGFIPELVRLATGRDLITAVVRLAAGQPSEPADGRLRYASIRFILRPLREPDELHLRVAAARRIDSIHEVRLYPTAGRRLRPRGDFRDRIGHVIAVASHAQTAIAACELAQSLVSSATPIACAS